MKQTIPSFLEKATNVYRTKNFIVNQRFGIVHDNEGNSTSFSHDIFYRRTKKRDLEYENIFEFRSQIDGKRMPTSMYSRNYID